MDGIRAGWSIEQLTLLIKWPIQITSRAYCGAKTRKKTKTVYKWEKANIAFRCVRKTQFLCAGKCSTNHNGDAGGNQFDKDEVFRDSIVGHMYYFTKSIIIRRGDYTNNRLSGFPPNLTVRQLQCLSKMCHFSSNYPIGSRTFHHRLVIAIAIDVLAHLVSRCMQCGVDTNTLDLEKGHRNIFDSSHKYWISAYQ